MSSRKTPIALLVSLALVSSTVSGGKESKDSSASSAQDSYHLQAYVIGSGGATATSAGYRANGTPGQPTPIGTGTAGGKTLYAGYWGQVSPRTPTGVTGPAAYRDELFQNYPNPFNPTTTILYTLARANPVEIKIFNVKGQRVKTLVDENKTPGLYRVTWDGTNDSGTRVASGVYFYRLEAGNFRSVKKLVLLK